jgi:hypothetical protein
MKGQAVTKLTDLSIKLGAELPVSPERAPLLFFHYLDQSMPCVTLY